MSPHYARSNPPVKADGVAVRPPHTLLVADTSVDPRHPLGPPSSLDARLRRGLEKQHFSTSIETGPAGYFLVIIAAHAGDHALARAIHERVKRLGWDITEIDLPRREGHL